MTARKNPYKNKTAVQAYEDKQNEIQGLMEAIKQDLVTHREDFSHEQRNWGYTGDLEHVKNLLQQAHDFLTGADD